MRPPKSHKSSGRRWKCQSFGSSTSGTFPSPTRPAVCFSHWTREKEQQERVGRRVSGSAASLAKAAILRPSEQNRPVGTATAPAAVGVFPTRLDCATPSPPPVAVDRREAAGKTRVVGLLAASREEEKRIRREVRHRLLCAKCVNGTQSVLCSVASWLKTPAGPRVGPCFN